MIREATQHDFAILVKMAQHIKIDYITPQHIQNDIFSKNLYVVVDKNNNIVAFGARVFDAHFQEYCIKRVCVPNARNRGKGYAQEIIKYLTVTRDRTFPLICTPWLDNYAMRHMLEDIGFKLHHVFNTNWCLYTIERD